MVYWGDNKGKFARRVEVANKTAPYKDERLMGRLIEWWQVTYPDGTPRDKDTHLRVLDLYQQYSTATGNEPIAEGFVDPQQFAKMLVAGGITDIGDGWWIRDTSTPPMDYLIRRARADVV